MLTILIFPSGRTLRSNLLRSKVVGLRRDDKPLVAFGFDE